MSQHRALLGLGPACGFAGSSLLGNLKHGKRPKWSVTEINHDFRNQEAWGGGLVFQSGPVSDWCLFQRASFEVEASAT